jgi:hypothetical protein
MVVDVLNVYCSSNADLLPNYLNLGLWLSVVRQMGAGQGTAQCPAENPSAQQALPM